MSPLVSIWRFFSSLKLTVTLLTLAMVLVFLGTMGEVHEGLYQAQQRYFRSLVIWAGPDGGPQFPAFPGGWLIGALLLVNLITAHISRFKFTRKKIGIFIVHAGLILLLFGGLVTDLFQVESYMRLSKGEELNYSTDNRRNELVFMDPTPADYDSVVSVPEALLHVGAVINDSRLPVVVTVKQYFGNADIRQRAPMVDAGPAPATQGMGKSLTVLPQAPITKMDVRDTPAAVVELSNAKGSLGTWLVSSLLDAPQAVTINGHPWKIALRGQRYYRPAAVKLLEFTHTNYQGTDIPQSFASRVQVTDSQTSEKRETVISMNRPLRYEGQTYYQSGFDQNDPNVTILQVVHNPGWLVPYISCSLIALGLVVQFLTHLIAFTMKRRTA
ncbi:MAG: cytochrome c biogenesis protein ResB [Chthoniobacteraceae bacterium]